MRRKISWILILILLGLGWQWRAEIVIEFNRLLARAPLSAPGDIFTRPPLLPLAGKPKSKVADVRPKLANAPTVSLPPPLRLPRSASLDIGQLTRSGVIRETNAARAKNGLPPLLENAELNAMAEAKVTDMLARQYFEHLSPSGIGPADLARAAGYEFLTVGENLALGNFGSDRALVTGWMNSPGHRANILNPSYREIGVFARPGQFDGERVWLATQEFGTPSSVCPSPDASSKASLDVLEQSTKSLEQDLAARRDALEQSRPKTRAEYDEYNRRVDEYNALVAEHNQLVAQFKAAIADYNAAVESYNRCLQTVAPLSAL